MRKKKKKSCVIITRLTTNAYDTQFVWIEWNDEIPNISFIDKFWKSHQICWEIDLYFSICVDTDGHTHEKTKLCGLKSNKIWNLYQLVYSHQINFPFLCSFRSYHANDLFSYGAFRHSQRYQCIHYMQNKTK